MKAVIVDENKRILVENIPQPQNAAPEHLLIKMEYMGINPGDRVFISGLLPKGFFPSSRYDIAGVSGVGKVLAIGEGVPSNYLGKYVTIYRSLIFSEELVGTWSEYNHMHYMQCAILPDSVEPKLYAGSLVNTITSYAFLRQMQQQGNKAIICTAGTSATGIALLGFSLAYNYPIISIVRTEEGKEQLEKLGAKNIVVQNDPNFQTQLQTLASALQATAVFDGVGGKLINDIIAYLPMGTSVYCYGYLDTKNPLSFSSSVLMRGISLQSFSNFKTETVQNKQQLAIALDEISQVLHMPHFATKIGKIFSLDDVEQALSYTAEDGGKAIFKV
jgi:NADPH:quinone reductase